MAFLIVERGNGSGRRIPIREFPVTIGRDATNSITIPDNEVSRIHFRLKQRGRLFILEDLESRNGTFVNGDRVLNATLKNGDKILVGTTELRFLASTADIQIASEIMNYDMILTDDAEISPIDISPQKETRFRPHRLNPTTLANNVAQDVRSVKDIYDYHGNLMVIEDFSEACRTLVKSIGQMMPNASRAALFGWSSQSRQLVPYASRNFGIKAPFLISQRAFEDAITRKQAILLLAEDKVAQPGRNRIILPMIHNGELICLMHVECDDPKTTFRTRDIEVAQALLVRSSPIFEAMLLKREIDSWLVGVIETVIATVEAKDTYTRGHSERVSRYSLAIAEELRLSRDIKRLLMISSLCHDIGKIGIPDAILKKASLLSAEEYQEMKLHPTIGADIISHMPNAKRFLSGIKYHHEKWDGTGYPEGLVGEEIPFFGRIVAIADVFDAMVSGRAYSGFMDQADAVQKLMDEKELFDPEILKAFVRAYEHGTLSIKTSTQNQEPPEDEMTQTKSLLKASSSRSKAKKKPK